MLVLAVATVAFAVFVGIRVIGVLYGIVLPPQPPRPPNLTELTHESAAYGVDDWSYSTSQDACQVARFYESNGGNCTFSPQTCSAGFIDSSIISPESNVAQCSGSIEFSIFAMKWEAIIAAGYRDGNPTHFKLSREIFWTGEVPPPMFPDTGATVTPFPP
jgi:hypothetical protein